MGIYGKNDQSSRTIITFAVTIIFQSLIGQESGLRSHFLDIVIF